MLRIKGPALVRVVGMQVFSSGTELVTVLGLGLNFTKIQEKKATIFRWFLIYQVSLFLLSRSFSSVRFL